MIVITDWERPLESWSGRFGHVADVLACATKYPLGNTGVAEVDITFGIPTPLAQIARAIYPLLGVDRGQHGYGHVEVGTVEVPPAGLALLPSRAAPGIAGLPGYQLKGVGLSKAELGLVGSRRAYDELQATAGDPDLAVVTHPILVSPSGHLVTTDRVEMPMVDLNVHNPIARLRSFEEPAGSLRLTMRDLELSLGTYEAEAQLPTWTRPAAAALSAHEVKGLREVDAIDLSGLESDAVSDDVLLYHRLAELAATGVVLHSLPPSFERASGVLGPTLTDLLRKPYHPSIGLARELRSVPQRREAMQRFGGYFEFAAHAESLGHRLLPTVSVVLSSTRPSRLVHVLRAMAAQTYPHLEVVLALHGDSGDPDPDLAEAVQVLGTPLLRYDRTTPFGSVLAEVARRASGDLVVKIDDDDVYGPRVIEDLVLAYIYSNADVVGRTTEYLYFEDIDHTVHRRFGTERYHYQLAGGTMMLSQAALNHIGGWRPSSNSTDRSILIRLGNSGGIGYRTHSLGYVYVRHSEGHTWKPNDSRLLLGSFEQWPGFMDEIVDA